MEEKKYRNMCIVFIFSVCSVLVLSGLIITNYFMNGRLLAKAECTCTKCDVKDKKFASSVRPKINVVKGEISGAGTAFEKVIPTSIDVNGNKVEYELQDAVINIVVLDDIILADVNHVFYSTLEVIDFSGNVITKFYGNGSSFDGGYGLIGSMFRGNYEVEGNEITIMSDNYGSNSKETAVCKTIKNDENAGVEFVQKITYLGNGEFSELTTVSTLTAGEYVSQNNTDCSWLSE